jgi:tetratricopeptide (TPR) repeat protein
MELAAGRSSSHRRRDWLTAVALAAITLAVFIPALDCGFVSFDDPSYVKNVPIVTRGLSGEGFRWAFATYRMGNWHPLTWLSLQLDAELWQAAGGKEMDPRAFHLGSVLLHALNAALLFLALRALTDAFRRSAAVALLFAVHPLRAESVVWISERKDVLSGFFGLLALLAYASYSHRPSVWRYLALMAAFTCSLMSKAMLVTLPCLLLVLDWWPLMRTTLQRAPVKEGAASGPERIPLLKKFRGVWLRLAIEKLPLLVVAIVFSLITLQAQESRGARRTREESPLGSRIENAALSYVAYLTKTVWPSGLAVFYPHPLAPGSGGLAHSHAVAACVFLVALSAIAVALRQRAPYFMVGWLWFLGSLVPTIGLVQVGNQAYADRYSYFPQIGLLLIICWGAADLVGKRTPALALIAAGTAAVALAAVTWKQIPVWNDSFSLWEHARLTTGENHVVLIGLGDALAEKHDERALEKAEEYYRKAIQLVPKAYQAHFGLGGLLYRQRKLKEAAEELGETCRLQSALPFARSEYGLVLFALGRVDEAEREQEAAIELAPDLPEPHLCLGQIALEKKQGARAIHEYRQALRLSKGSFDAHLGLGVALKSQGALDEALQHLQAAINLEPRSEQAYFRLGQALEAKRDAEGAATCYERAVQLQPAMARDWYALSNVRRQQGRTQEADQCLSRARQLDPALAKPASKAGPGNPPPP